MKKIKISTIIIYLFLIFLVVVYVAPLLWMVMVSMKTNKELIDAPFSIPKEFIKANYVDAWTKGKLGIAMLNSAIVCVVSLILSIVIGTMAAFAIGIMKWKYSKAVMLFFLLGMMLPIHCILIPLYKNIAAVGLSDSLPGLIIPYTVFSLPVTIYIMTGFFESLPKELFEAAFIDGCSVYRSFAVVGVPLTKTGLFVVGLMSFVANWNEMLCAVIFLSTDTKKTLPVALTKFAGPHATNYVQQFAAIIIAVLPTIVVYSCFSNQIVDGLTQGAVKG